MCFHERNICRRTLSSLRTLVQFSLLLSLAIPAIGQVSDVPDSALVEQVREKFYADYRMPLRGIVISAYNGAIRLTGIVEKMAQKEWAEELAYSIEGVKVVDNQLWVDTGRITDKQLFDKVMATLRSARITNFSRVRADVYDGVVTLKGYVSCWGEKQQASELIMMLSGVRKIVDELKVRDARNRTDDEIEKAVIKALREKISMYGDYKVKVSVVRGVARLHGKTRSLSDKRTAIRTTIFVPGVADVVDKIEVLPE